MVDALIQTPAIGTTASGSRHPRMARSCSKVKSLRSISEPGRQRLHPFIEPRMRDEIEARQHERVRHVAILLQIVRDPTREHWPVRDTDRTARPAVVPRV